ncbi:unnamed protein product [Lactuca saligna]|uniref:VAL1-3 N-terminal zinc finger domain-containing protein n=1 Tax=Lactuca saligna TaxID=75948 RepID=A0AA36EC60_LACSI|nr:unnamed protein product [Lactuca saligna]
MRTTVLPYDAALINIHNPSFMNLLLCAADVMETATPRRFRGECKFCEKPVHCGYVASKYLHECIDLGGISSIKCIRARVTQALTPMQSNPTDIPNGFIPFSATWHSYVISNQKNENSMVMSFIDRLRIYFIT